MAENVISGETLIFRKQLELPHKMRWLNHGVFTTNSFIAMAMTPSELCKFDGHKVVYSKLPNHVFHSTFGLLSKIFCQTTSH